MIPVLWRDERVIVCLKPQGVLSTDQPGGLPGLLQEQLGLAHTPRTVHRLDQVVGGLMVLALGPAAAAILTEQIQARTFEKAYLAVLHGCPEAPAGTLRDLLGRDKARRMTYVADAPGKGIQEAVLDYTLLERSQTMSLVRIQLHTGRTHQIRVQFASRGLPLVGERRYSTLADDCPIALWSHRLAFVHPFTKQPMDFTAPPPELEPWTRFSCLREEKAQVTEKSGDF